MAFPPRNIRTFKVRALLRLRSNKIQTDVWKSAPADGNIATVKMRGIRHGPWQLDGQATSTAH
jgi:hypothetical protein